MKTYKVHDKSVVVVLSKQEAKALFARSLQHTGIQESKLFKSAQNKLIIAIGEVMDEPTRSANSR
jgi:hypothetical protein